MLAGRPPGAAVAAYDIPMFTWGKRTYIMGILNVTPDSFSGDGLAGRLDEAVARALRMVEDGADVVDIGGQSTRPGHAEVSAEEELERVMPVLTRVVARVSVPVSIDSYRYEVVEAALAGGATIINDVWGLKREPRLADLAAGRGALLVLMHNQAGTDYAELVSEVVASLHTSVQTAVRAGVAREQLMVDPGIGFGKTPGQNLEMLRGLPRLRSLGLPVLLGTSRKSVIGRVLDLPVEDRLEGTAATVALGIGAGVDMVRVHDVAQVARVCRMADAVVRGFPALERA
ncbi:MAG: dihydropteroate synthase [Candidatus Dormibacteria bacterium]